MVPEGPWASRYHGDSRAAPGRWGSYNSTARVKEGRAHPRPRHSHSHQCREALLLAENKARVG